MRGLRRLQGSDFVSRMLREVVDSFGDDCDPRLIDEVAQDIEAGLVPGIALNDRAWIASDLHRLATRLRH
jgi:hypothetical protein